MYSLNKAAVIMRKIVFLLLPLVFLLCAENTGYAQQHNTGFPPPRVYNKYKKKDTVKPDPYKVDTLMHPIPFSRVLFHDRITAEQNIADAADGKADHKVSYKPDST